jgi:hypothetical protein
LLKKRLSIPAIDLNLLQRRSPASYTKHIDEMFAEMGGEYNRHRIESLIKRKSVFELMNNRTVSIKSKLTDD